MVVFDLGNVLLPGPSMVWFVMSTFGSLGPFKKRKKLLDHPTLGITCPILNIEETTHFPGRIHTVLPFFIFEITYDFSKFDLHGFCMTIRYGLVFCFLSVRQAGRELLNLRHLLVILLVQTLRRFLVNLLRTPIRAPTVQVCLQLVQTEHILPPETLVLSPGSEVLLSSSLIFWVGFVPA